MGLDMYLRARKDIYQRDWSPEGEPAPTIIKVDDMKVTQYEMEAAYWRKHPNLHGYIVKTFAEGVDECQQIDLDVENCRQIAAAIRANDLPYTQGFFFGDSDWHKDEVEANAKIFDKLAEWLEVKPDHHNATVTEYRSAYYRASW